MIHLKTLGAIDLRLSNGTEVRSVLAQPKRLALLAYLAVASCGYHRRDSLLAIFWPDLDQQHARNALSRAIYFLRRALGDEAIVGRGDDELHVSQDLVQCDARDFDAALSAGRLEDGLALYHGDLLEGFFLSNAPHFERWLEDQRAELRSRAAHAARHMAQAMGADGDPLLAEQWARRALALSPYDEGVLTQLMLLLDRQGGRGHALAEYERFVRRLRADLGADASAQTKAMVDAWPEESTVRPLTTKARKSADPDSVHPIQGQPSVRPNLRAQWRGVSRLALASAAVAMCAWVVDPMSSAFSDSPREPPRSPTLAVLPFSVRAPTQVYDFLREGLMDLLSAKINSAVGLRSVNPAVLLATPELGQKADLAPSDGRAVGNRLGADFYVLGTVVVVGAQAQITARLHHVDGAETPLASTTASGAVDDLMGLVDRLTVDLVASMGSSAERLANVASMTTQSPTALRAYLDGERAFRQASFAPLVRFMEPLAAYRQAVTIDSTFALAYYRLSVAAAWADSLELARWASARAMRYMSRLPAYYRSLSDGLDAFFNGDGRRAILAFRAAIANHPDDAEVWLRLGDAILNYGPLLGAAPGDLWEPYAMAAQLEGGRQSEAGIVLSHLAMQEGDFRALDTLIPKGYPEGIPPHWQLLTALERHDSADARDALHRLERAGPLHQTFAGVLVTRYLSDARLGRRLVKESLNLVRGSDWFSEAQLWIAQVEWAAGRPDAALRQLTALAARDPRRAAEFQALLAAWPVNPAPRQRLESARQALRDGGDLPVLPHPRGERPLSTAAEAIRLYLLGLLSVRLGERDSALTYLETLTAQPSAARLGSLTRDLALCLKAEVTAQLERAPDEALGLLGSARYQIPFEVLQAHHVLYHVLARMRFLQGQWSHSLGRPAEALRWYASLGLVDQHLDLPLWAPALLMSAPAYEETGQVDRARVEYARFVTLWQDAEPGLLPFVDDARAHLVRLGR